MFYLIIYPSIPYSFESTPGGGSPDLSAVLVSDLASDLATDLADFGLSFSSLVETALLLMLTLSLSLAGLAALLLDLSVSPSAGFTDVEDPLAILLLTSSMAFFIADSAEVSPVKTMMMLLSLRLYQTVTKHTESSNLKENGV